jgi:hypothetical protein
MSAAILRQPPDDPTLRRLAAEAPPIAGHSALSFYLLKSRRELAQVVAALTPNREDLSDEGRTPSERRRLRLWAAARLAFEEQARQRDERIQRGREKRRRAAILRADDLLRGAEASR